MKLIKLCLLYLLICNPFVVNAQDLGALAMVPDSPFSTGTLPQSVAFSPLIIKENIAFAAVTNGDGTVSVYNVNPMTGAFIEVQGSPFLTGTFPTSVAFSPIFQKTLFAAVANAADNTLSVYTVSQTTGIFTEVTGSPFATGLQPRSVAFSPSEGNLFVAVANAGDDTISVYQIKNTNPFNFSFLSSYPTGISPFSIAFSPIIDNTTKDILFAAVANESSNDISVYEVALDTGIFSPISNSFLPTGEGPNSIAFSPRIPSTPLPLLFAAVTNSFGSLHTVSVYNVNIFSGEFTPAFGSPFQTGINPVSVAFSPLLSINSPTDGPTNLFAAVVNQKSNNLSVYNVNLSSGEFSLVGKGLATPTGNKPNCVAYSPIISENLFAAVTNTSDNSVSVYLAVLLPDITDKIPPPTNLKGRQKLHLMGLSLKPINILTWKAPSTEKIIVAYKIYRDNLNKKPIAMIKSHKSLKFKDQHCKPGKTYTYYIVSVEASGKTSVPAKIKVRPAKQEAKALAGIAQ